MDRDNQQERSISNRSWLAGIIEGEGSFMLIKNLTFPGRHIAYRPHISVTNSNAVLIQEYRRALAEEGLPYYIDKPRLVGPYNKRPQVHVVIKGIKRVKRAIDLLLPYFRGRIGEAQILLEFCRYRLSVPHVQPHGEHEEQFVETLRYSREGNRFELESSETARLTG